MGYGPPMGYAPPMGYGPPPGYGPQAGYAEAMAAYQQPLPPEAYPSGGAPYYGPQGAQRRLRPASSGRLRR